MQAKRRSDAAINRVDTRETAEEPPATKCLEDPLKKHSYFFFFFAPDDPVFCADIHKLKPFSSLKYLKSTTIQSFSRILF